VVIGDWDGADPRYRGYRPTKRGVHLDDRVRKARDLVPHTDRGVLIDLGAGDGFITATLQGAALAKVGVAVDLGRPGALLAGATTTHVTAPLPGPLPFRDRCADVLVSLEAIEHLLDPDALLQEAHRLLKPGGHLILSTPRLDGGLVILSLLLGFQPPGVEASSRARYGNRLGAGRPSGHVHLFTKKALAEALTENGFVAEVWTEGRFSSSWWQSVRAVGRPRPRDLLIAGALWMYDRIPFRKDVLIVRAVKPALR
jgi:SAM-dependent methyltransferase